MTYINLIKKLTVGTLFSIAFAFTMEGTKAGPGADCKEKCKSIAQGDPKRAKCMSKCDKKHGKPGESKSGKKGKKK